MLLLNLILRRGRASYSAAGLDKFVTKLSDGRPPSPRWTAKVAAWAGMTEAQFCAPEPELVETLRQLRRQEVQYNARRSGD